MFTELPTVHLIATDEGSGSDSPPLPDECANVLEVPDMPQIGDDATHRSVYEVTVSHVHEFEDVLEGVELKFPSLENTTIYATPSTGHAVWMDFENKTGWHIGRVLCQCKANGCVVKVRDASYEDALADLRNNDYAEYLEMWKQLVQRVRDTRLELDGTDFTAELEARVDWDPRVLEELHTSLVQHIASALSKNDDAAASALHQEYPVMELTKKMHIINERLGALHEQDAEEMKITSSIVMFFVVDWYDSKVVDALPESVRLCSNPDVPDAVTTKLYSTESEFRRVMHTREQALVARSILGDQTSEEEQEERVRNLWYISQPQVLLASGICDARGAFQAHFVVAPRHQNAVPAPDAIVELTTPAGASVHVRFNVHNILRRLGFLDMDKPDFEQAHREFILRTPESWNRYRNGLGKRLRGFDFEPTVLEGADAWEVQAMAFAGQTVCNIESEQDGAPSTKPKAVHEEIFVACQQPLESKCFGLFFAHLHLMFSVTPK